MFQEEFKSQPILEVLDLGVHFDVSAPWLRRVFTGESRLILRAVDGISFRVNRGESFSLVGESGCGKSTVARAIVGLYPATGGEIRFQGAPLQKKNGKASEEKIRSRMQMIFQDPYASLNPRMNISEIIGEPTRPSPERQVKSLPPELCHSPFAPERWGHWVATIRVFQTVFGLPVVWG